MNKNASGQLGHVAKRSEPFFDLIQLGEK